MSKLVPFVFGAALALSPAIVCAQTNNGNPNNPNDNNTTTGQTTPGQANQNNMNNGTGNHGTTTNGTTPGAANNNTGAANRAMPNTAADWLPALLGGSLLAGAGVSLRRKYARES